MGRFTHEIKMFGIATEIWGECQEQLPDETEAIQSLRALIHPASDVCTW